MANRLWSALLMLMLGAPAVGASSILGGCSKTPQIPKPEPAEQRAVERHAPRRERRDPRLARKEYDG
jgi:hypothetical protein